MSWLPHLWWWIEVHTGTVNESGPYYGFWSGFGSDIGQITLVTGVVLAVRHHNCHVRGCWRLGRSVEGTPYVACPKHHPAHRGTKRAVDQNDLRPAAPEVVPAAPAKRPAPRKKAAGRPNVGARPKRV